MTTAARRGLWLLPLAGILTGLPWLAFFDLKPGGEGSDPHDEALRAISASTKLAGYVYIAGFICLLVAVVALCVLAAVKRPSTWAAAALALDVAAVALIMPVQGVLGLADPIVASYYLGGHEDVGPLLIQLSGGSFAAQIDAWAFLAIGVAVIGAAATGISTWRADISRWSGVLLAAGFALPVTTIPLLCWVGSALLLGAGGWIAWRVSSKEAGLLEAAAPSSFGRFVEEVRP